MAYAVRIFSRPDLNRNMIPHAALVESSTTQEIRNGIQVQCSELIAASTTHCDTATFRLCNTTLRANNAVDAVVSITETTQYVGVGRSYKWLNRSYRYLQTE